MNLGLAFRAEVVASQAASNLGIDSEMPRPLQSGGWFVLERVSGPDHTAGNITQDLGQEHMLSQVWRTVSISAASRPSPWNLAANFR